MPTILTPDEFQDEDKGEHDQPVRQLDPQFPVVEPLDPLWLPIGHIPSMLANEAAEVLIKYDPDFRWKISPNTSWDMSAWGLMLWNDLMSHICWSQATINICPSWFGEDRRWSRDIDPDSAILDKILRENYDTWLAVQKRIVRRQEEDVFQATFAQAVQSSEDSEEGQTSQPSQNTPDSSDSEELQADQNSHQSRDTPNSPTSEDSLAVHDDLDSGESRRPSMSSWSGRLRRRR